MKCMTSHDLEGIALALVADGKGILAADETVFAFTRRFQTLENLKAGQRALRSGSSLNRATSLGNSTDEMEQTSPAVHDPPHCCDWHDE
jgi:fructose-bisphosphate aldolase class 1